MIGIEQDWRCEVHADHDFLPSHLALSSRELAGLRINPIHHAVRGGEAWVKERYAIAQVSCQAVTGRRPDLNIGWRVDPGVDQAVEWT